MLSPKLRIAASLFVIIFIASFMYEYLHSFREGIDENGDGAVDLTSTEYYLIDNVMKQLKSDDPKFSQNFDVSAIMQISKDHPNYAKIISGNQTIPEKMASVQALLNKEPIRVSINDKFSK
jgi:hypothetical protein